MYVAWSNYNTIQEVTGEYNSLCLPLQTEERFSFKEKVAPRPISTSPKFIFLVADKWGHVDLFDVAGSCRFLRLLLKKPKSDFLVKKHASDSPSFFKEWWLRGLLTRMYSFTCPNT